MHTHTLTALQPAKGGGQGGLGGKGDLGPCMEDARRPQQAAPGALEGRGRWAPQASPTGGSVAAAAVWSLSTAAWANAPLQATLLQCAPDLQHTTSGNEILNENGDDLYAEHMSGNGVARHV